MDRRRGGGGVRRTRQAAARAPCGAPRRRGSRVPAHHRRPGAAGVSVSGPSGQAGSAARRRRFPRLPTAGPSSLPSIGRGAPIAAPRAAVAPDRMSRWPDERGISGAAARGQGARV